MTPSDKKENEKKPDNKAKERLKFYCVVAVLTALCGGFIWFIFKPSEDVQAEGSTGINTSIPDAVAPETESDKAKAYEQEEFKKRRQEKVRTLQDVTEDYLTEKEPSSPQEIQPKRNTIKESQQQRQVISRQISTFYEEPKQDPRMSELEKQVKELSARLEHEQAKEKDPVELMEKSYELAARYFPGQGNGEVKSIQASTSGTSAKGQTVTPAGRATENIVSSLATPPGLDTIPRNYGFSTAVGAGQELPSNTIRACVAEDQTVTTGARIKLRLLEPLQVGTVLIPANTPLYGSVRIEGQRMTVSVNSIESGGNILPVELAAHDMDGKAGLFVPNTAERTAMKEAAANIGAGFGTSISFTSSAAQQLAMDLTRGVLSGGSQYLATKMREVKVAVKANYQLLLISKKQQ